MSETLDVFYELNEALDRAYQADDPPIVSFRGRPWAHVLNVNPLAYERYRTITRRRPRIIGSFALRGFALSAQPKDPVRDIWRIWPIIGEGDGTYLVAPNSKDLLNTVYYAGDHVGVDIEFTGPD